MSDIQTRVKHSRFYFVTWLWDLHYSNYRRVSYDILLVWLYLVNSSVLLHYGSWLLSSNRITILVKLEENEET